jgi:hypothetical protein
MEKLDFLDMLICLAVGFLGLLAAVFGFVADAKLVPGCIAEFIDGGTACLSPKSHKTLWEIVSPLLLPVAQLIVNVATACVCYGNYRSNWKKEIVAIITNLVLSWITFLLAIALFMHGAFIQGSLVALASIMSNINYSISIAQVKNMGKPTLISVRTLMNGPRILSCTAIGGITAFLFNHMDI